MESVTRLFQMTLSDFSIEEIKKAFIFYMQHNNEMPTPADIYTIIKRGGKPPLDKSVYIRISKKSGEERTQEEWQYLDEYERFMINGDL